jgi:hypothetical protein
VLSITEMKESKMYVYVSVRQIYFYLHRIQFYCVLFCVFIVYEFDSISLCWVNVLYIYFVGSYMFRLFGLPLSTGHE